MKLKILMGLLLWTQLSWGSADRTREEHLFDLLPLIQRAYLIPFPSKMNPSTLFKENLDLIPLMLEAFEESNACQVTSLPALYNGELWPFLIEFSPHPVVWPHFTLLFAELITATKNDDKDSYRHYNIYLCKGNEDENYNKQDIVANSKLVGLSMYRFVVSKNDLINRPVCLIDPAYQAFYEWHSTEGLSYDSDATWCVSKVSAAQDGTLIFTLKQSAKTLEEYSQLPAATVALKRRPQNFQTEEGVFQMDDL